MAAEGAAASTAANSSQGSGTGAIHRLVRTLSGNKTTSQPISPVLTSGIVPPSISETHGEPTHHLPTDTGRSPTPKAPSTKEKVLFAGVIDRLKNLSFGLGKSSDAEHDSISAPPGPRNVSNSALPPIAETSASIPIPSPPEASTVEADPVAFPSADTTDTDADPAEPTYLARKIQSLIDALPLPRGPAPSPPPKKPPKPPARDRAGRPIPPPGATPIKDTKLIAMLSSATIMNGGHVWDDRRERRVSVWSVLESLGSTRGEDGNDHDAEDAPGEGSGDGGGEGEEDGGSVFSDTSGIMMYSPLLPTNDSLVEIAESGVVSPPPSAPLELQDSAAAQQLAGWMGMWPFSIWGGGGVSSTATSTSVPAAAATSPVPSVAALPVSPVGSPYRAGSPPLPGSPRGARLRIQGQRVWVPSTTKLSVQVMWWGYRLYLPPPVLDVLDDKQVEATKRAALITTALTWFFSHIPAEALPPAVRPAVLLLQTLVPYVGYIGTFISWSWGTIKSYDTGYGVILTATWLLPVALIPGTWEARDFPPPSPPEQTPSPLPAPSSPPPASPPPAPAPTTPAPPPAPPSPLPPPPPPPPPPSPPPAPSPPTSTSPPPPQSPRPQPQPPATTLPSPPQTPQTPAQPARSPPPSATPAPSSLPRPLPLPIVLAEPSDPLPPWVPPPPPPSPPKIPLPDLGPEEDAAEVEVVERRFGFGPLKVTRRSSGRGGEDQSGERKKGKGKGKARLKAMVMGAAGAAGSKSG